MRDLSDRANHVFSHFLPLPRAPYFVEVASMAKATVNQRLESNRFSGALAPLNNPNYRLLLLGFAIGQMIMPLQFITQILWVQHFAPADIWLILVALIAACRGLGAFCFGLYGGALADRFNRKHLLIFILVLQMIGTLLIAALMMAGDGGALSFVLFFVMTFLTSGLQSIDAPTRLALLPDVVGPALTPAGMSLNQVAGQVAMPLAMMMTGFLIHQFDFGGAYLISALGLAAASLFIFVYRNYFLKSGPEFESYLRTISEGSVVEWSGFVVLIASSCLFFNAAKRWINSLSRYILFAASAGTFAIGMEEMSWGQMIFNWDSPALFDKYNIQHETGIHNLWFVHYHTWTIASIVMTLFFVVSVISEFLRRYGRVKERSFADILLPLGCTMSYFLMASIIYWFTVLAKSGIDLGGYFYTREQEIGELFFYCGIFIHSMHLYFISPRARPNQ